MHEEFYKIIANSEDFCSEFKNFRNEEILGALDKL